MALVYISNFQWILNHGIGCLVRYTYAKDYGAKLFEFTEIKADHCLLVHKPIFDPPEEVQVAFPDLKVWRMHKGPSTVLCPAATVQKHLLLESHPCVIEELNRAKVQQALLEACAAHQVAAEDVGFTKHPNNVYTLKAVKKAKALKLLPWGVVQKCKGAVDKKGKTIIKGFGMEWTVTAWKSLGDFDGEGTLSPFAWVKRVEDPSSCNMVVAEVALKDGVKIPCLTNPEPLVANVVLQVLSDKAAEKIAKEKSEEAQSAKKAKKSQA